MNTVIRKYKGATELVEALISRRSEIAGVMGSIPGLVTYQGVRTADGLVTITVCQTEDAAQESTRRAAAWVKENLPAASIDAPEVTTGEVVVDFTGQGV